MVRFLPAYAAADHTMQFLLLDVRSKHVINAGAFDVLQAAQRAEAANMSLNTLRYVLTACRITEQYGALRPRNLILKYTTVQNTRNCLPIYGSALYKQEYTENATCSYC